MYFTIPFIKSHKNKKVAIEGSNVTSLFDHLSFHSDGTVHWRCKNKKYLPLQKMKHPLFNLPDTHVVHLFSVTYPNLNISAHYRHDDNSGFRHVFDYTKSDFFSIMCFLASKDSWLAFYTNNLKRYDQSKDWPLLIDAGTNSKILLIIKSEYVPNEIYSEFLANKARKLGAANFTDAMIGGFSILPPPGYIQKYMVRST